MHQHHHFKSQKRPKKSIVYSNGVKWVAPYKWPKINGFHWGYNYFSGVISAPTSNWLVRAHFVVTSVLFTKLPQVEKKNTFSNFPLGRFCIVTYQFTIRINHSWICYAIFSMDPSLGKFRFFEGAFCLQHVILVKSFAGTLLGTRKHIPPNGKLGKSSTQKCRKKR